ncbi:serine hydrolase domain-containing protein [Jannaschia marina]|uniref:serine hydrolase domain-containing protein n=1 Tax=Jannaschia marina TaxID=2741674 RepID=UPI0015CA9256|nr:serine hydrolase domain-containing protein [Jannaschia marina]
MIRALALWFGLAGAAAGDEWTASVSAVWQDGETEIAADGMTHEGGRPVAAADAWHIGSITKSMTATLAARLVEQGRIEWDATLGDVLDAPKPWRDVTLVDLLTHRSGMEANLPLWRTVLRPDRPAYVAAMLNRDPEGERGNYLYSNAGYTLAGAMLEVAGGAPWEALMAREVFAPLGMEGMGFGAPDGIWGHRGRAVPPGPRADNLPAMGPAGTAHGPPAAILTYLAAHARRDPAFLPPAAWERLHTPIEDYALGWGVRDGVLFHAGSNTMWLAQVAIEGDTAVFVAVNAFTPRAEAYVAAETLRLLSGGPPARPEAPRP